MNTSRLMKSCFCTPVLWWSILRYGSVRHHFWFPKNNLSSLAPRMTKLYTHIVQALAMLCIAFGITRSRAQADRCIMLRSMSLLLTCVLCDMMVAKMWHALSAGRWDIPPAWPCGVWGRWQQIKDLLSESMFACETLPWPQNTLLRCRVIPLLCTDAQRQRWLPPCGIFL